MSGGKRIDWQVRGAAGVSAASSAGHGGQWVRQQGMSAVLQVGSAAGDAQQDSLQQHQSRCTAQVLSQAAHLSQQSLCLSILAGSACKVGKVSLVGSISL